MLLRLKEEVKHIMEENYTIVVNAIKEHGTPSKRYEGDIEISFGELRELCSSQIEGLQVVLKSLKRKKIVDFLDAALLRDEDTISLIGVFDQQHEGETVKFDDFTKQFRENKVTPSYR